MDRDTDGLDVLPITDERPSASFRTSRGLRVMTPAERAERSAKVWDLHLRGGTIPFEEFLARRGRTTTTTTPPTEPKP